MSAPSNLARRVLVAVIFGPLFLALFWLGNGALLVGLWSVVGVGTWEFCRLQRCKGLHPWTRFGIVASLAWCLWVYTYGARILVYPMLCLMLATLVLSLSRRGERFRIADGAATLTGVLYVGFLGSFAMQVRNLPGIEGAEDWSRGIAVVVLVGIWATDIASYFAGSAFGRWHPLPDISPGKTEAGFIGGVAVGAGVVLLGSGTFGLLSSGEALGLGLVVALGSQLGDLVQSVMKRDAGVKDASDLIPGHGGVLDRFDSFLFAYPLTFLYLSVLRELD